MTPGIYYGMSDREYHSERALSASGLKQYARTAAHWAAIWAEEGKETPALLFGRAFHCAILEPEKFAREYIVKPGGMTFATKEGKAWRAEAELSGKCILSADDALNLERMADQVQGHETASGIIGGTEHEVSLFWNDVQGFPCKARCDIVNKELKIIGDIKTCENANPVAFGRSVANYQYHWQAYWYLHGMSILTGEEWKTFIFAAMEKALPHAIAVYLADEQMLYKAKLEIDELLPGFAACWKRDEWPAYPDRVLELSLPRWAQGITE